jgi:hypothetical protein
MKLSQLPRSVPVQKGSGSAFTVLGNWYDYKNPKSMASLAIMMLDVNGKRDAETAREEIEDAVK